MAKLIDKVKASELWTQGIKLLSMCVALRVSEKTLRNFKRQNPEIFPKRQKRVPGQYGREDIEKAAEMYKNGATYTEIGDAIGRTRKAIGGIAARNRDLFPERNGDKNKHHTSARRAAQKPVKIKQTEEQRRETASANARRMAFHEATKPVIPHKPKEQAHQYDQSRLPYAVTLADLDTKTCCSWSVTDHPRGSPNLFCNEVKTGKNYCHVHTQRSVRIAA